MENSEVICISSDDEDTGQGKSNGRQPVIKKLLNTSIKTEIVAHESGEIPVCGQKRKASQVDDNIFKTQTKVLREEKNVQEPVVEEGSMSSELTSGCQSKETIALKPKLVIKESIPFSPSEQDIFPMFISLCLQKDRSDDMKIITNKLKRRYEQLDLEYANSEAFIKFINEKRNLIINSKNQLYTHIAEVNNEMKNRCNKKSTLLSSNKKCTSNSQKLHNNNSQLLSSDNVHTNNVGDATINESDVTNKEDGSKDRATEKKIKLILKTMKKCEMHIKKLEESEINFDDEDNSSYISLERYKHRMVELYNKYCQYTGENIDAGRQYLRPKHLSTTGIITVDHAITNFINSKLSKLNKLKKIGTFTDAVIFPDYKDMLDCVERCNNLSNLGLDTKEQQRIAKKAFIELGEYLQRSRRNDYWDTFSLFLENKEDDPALKDTELAQKLGQNKREGEQRLANVFEEYVKKQENVRGSLIDLKTSSSEEDEEESIENEEGDNNNDEDDNISIAEGSLSTDKNKSSSGSETEEEEEEEEDKEEEIEEQKKKEEENEKDEEETDKDDNKISTTKIDTNVKVSVQNTDVVEVDGDCRTNATILKDTVGDSKLEETNSNDVASIPNCTNESESGATEGNNGTALSNDSVDEESSVKVDVPIDRTKEDEANVTEESMDSKPLEQEKPLLRVRSFARHPTTWKDESEKVKESKVEKKLEKDKSISSLNDSIVDLTLDTSDENIVSSCANTGKETKMLPRMQDKLKTILIPASTSIIKVQDISKCHRIVNPQVVGPNGVMKSRNGQAVAQQQNVLTIAKQPTVLSFIGQPVDEKQNAILKLQVRQNSERNVQIQPTNTSAVAQHNQAT